ncbi:hypothetical protein GCM10027343_42200 [Noviherbaspirillum agri]
MLRISQYFAVLTVFGVAGMLLAAPAWAADLTIPPGPRAMGQRAVQQTPDKPRKDMQASRTPRPIVRAEQNRQLIVPAVKSKRIKNGKRKIRTYNLYRDPVFKLAGAVTSHTPLTARPGEARPAVGMLGSGYNYSVPSSMPPGMAMARAAKPAEPGTAALKMEDAERNADAGGLEFACREKAFTPNYIRRDMSACYQSNLDKSWRTRTFVSQGLTDGGREWGGGLSLIYAH